MEAPKEGYIPRPFGALSVASLKAGWVTLHAE